MEAGDWPLRCRCGAQYESPDGMLEGEASAPVEQSPKPLDCDHRGAAIGARACLNCGNRGRIETVYACAIHGECTINRWRNVAGDHVCKDCHDRTTFTPTPIDRRRIEHGSLPHDKRFNCSMIRFRGSLLMAYRLGDEKARISLSELGPTYQVLRNWILPLQSGNFQEDPRLWIYRGELYVSFSAVQYRGGICTDVAYARLAKRGDDWTVDAEWLPHFDGRNAWEKNWGFFDHGGDLLAVYDIKPHRILKIEGDRAEIHEDEPCDFGGKAGVLHGGAPPVLWQGEYYCFYHRVLPGKPKTYTIDLYTFDAKPPFSPSRHIPSSLLTPDLAHRPTPGQVNCAFPGGAYRDQYGDWAVSFGYQDKWCEAAKWNGWDIERALKPLAGGPFGGLATAIPTDPIVWKQVNLANEYRLPDDMTGQIVVDVGANIGSFSRACLDRGAAKVVACEPVAEFLDCARKNCRDDRMDFVLAYITGRQGEEVESLYRSPAPPRAEVKQISLDAILESLPRIDLLKLDCEGPEHAIIEHCDLSRVRRICGECHQIGSRGIDSLLQGLRHKDFDASWERAGDGLWLFWATRSTADESTMIQNAKDEGLQLHVGSYGGSGVSMLAEYLDRKRRAVTPAWNRLKHYHRPLELGLPRLCVLANPIMAYGSIVRRGLAEGVAEAITGRPGVPLAEAMELFYAGWIESAVPLVFAKYESLWQVADKMGAALGIDLSDFPEQLPRETVAGDAAEAIEQLAAKWRELPEFFVRE